MSAMHFSKHTHQARTRYQMAVLLATLLQNMYQQESTENVLHNSNAHFTGHTKN